jgi:hypothetical protein
MESAELLPGASLGDVLAEELGIDIPHDAVVLIEPVASAEAEEISGHALGQQLGHILVELASTGHSPLIRPEAFAVTGAEPARVGSRPMVRDYVRIVTDIDRRGFQEELRAQ